MFVPCPHCGFLVALIVAEGSSPQRCPRCRGELGNEGEAGSARSTAPGQPHDVRDSVRDSVRDARRDPAATIEPAAPEVAVRTNATTPDEPAVVATKAPRTAEPKSPAPSSSTRTARRRAKTGTPSFARVVSRSRTNGFHWPEIVAASALGVLLAAQLVLAQRSELAADERWRPLIGAVCTVLWCDVPAWHEPDAYTMLARSVEPADNQPGILTVQASFRNDARWPQPWPALLLNLSDVNGQPVAARVFQASEYRHADTTADSAELAPGQSASAEFQIIEPALPVVAFTFDFR